MTTTIMVGYSLAALNSLQSLRPDGTVILVEEPDVLRKREIRKMQNRYSVLREIVALEYQRDGAADAFYVERRELNPVSITPIVEYATPFAARLAERYNRPGSGYGASLLLRNKDQLRLVTRAAGIRNPRWRLVDTIEEAEAFLAFLDETVILKPANRQGSIGTVIVGKQDDFAAAWAFSQQRDEGVFVPDRGLETRTLLEEFIAGPEYSVEALVQGGAILFANVTEKRLFEGATPVESGHIVPATAPAATQDKLVAATGRVLEATGFCSGIVHCEWRWNANDPVLIECAGRFAGDGIIELIQLAYGFDIVGSFHALMRGEPLEDLPTSATRAASVCFLGGVDGIVSDVRVDEAGINAIGGLRHFDMSAAVGQSTRRPRSSWDRLGSVTTIGGSPEEAYDRARLGVSRMVIEYER